MTIAAAESRRAFLRRGVAIGAPLLLGARLTSAAQAATPAINARDFGARGDGRAKDTRAIQAAIDRAAASGGTAHLPPGDYLSGTLHLRSGVTLRLDAGATLIASRDDRDFDAPERLGYESFADEETTDFAFALLRGRGLHDVAIVGPGRIDGNRSWRTGPKPIALKQCRRVQVRDLRVDDAGNYAVSLLGCDEVDVRRVTIRNGYSDGVDPDCCRHVRIADCDIESRDDAIAIKSSFALGEVRHTEDVVVSGCRLVTLHNGLKLGTESVGDFRDVVFRDCTVASRRHFIKGHMSSGVALETVDGGRLERVTVARIRMTDVRAPLFIRLARRGQAPGPRRAGALTDVSIADVVATGAMMASSITGIPAAAVGRVALARVRVVALGGGSAELLSHGVPQFERRYPDATMYVDLPAYGLYCRHVTGLRLGAVELRVEQPDGRPAVVLEDVCATGLAGVHAMPPVDGEAIVQVGTPPTCADSGPASTARPRGDGEARGHVPEDEPSAVD